MQADRKNVFLLSSCQALLTTSNVVLISINGLAGHALATSKALATLPVTCFVLGGALSTMPASLLMQRIGRVRGFTLGTLVGVASALLCAGAVYLHDFWLLCAGNIVFGGYNASAQYYRFAAADAASPEFKNKAISLVMAGGIAGGVIGPESTKLTKDALAVPFLGSYLSLILFALLALALVQGMKIPPLTAAEKASAARPLGVIVRQPIFLVAVLGAVVSFTVMNLLMTATPLAMQMCHHSFNDSASVIEWHVIAMYAPAFVTGALIQRFGVLQLMLAGAVLMLACVGIALLGISFAHFWVALVLLGVGWSFLYVGGTTLLTESYISPSERAKTQGLNDFVMFSAMGISSLSAGVLVTKSGWSVVNYASLPLIFVAIAGILWLKLTRDKDQGQLSSSVTGA